jgi:hypothetical protein
MSQPHLPSASWTPEIDFVTSLQDAISAYITSLLGYVVFITCTGVQCWDYGNKYLWNVVSPCQVPIVHWCTETRKHKRRGKQKSKFIVIGQFLGKPSSSYGALTEGSWACEVQYTAPQKPPPSLRKFERAITRYLLQYNSFALAMKVDIFIGLFFLTVAHRHAQYNKQFSLKHGV